MIHKLVYSQDKDAMLKAIQNGLGDKVKIDYDKDAGTVIVTSRKSGKKFFRGIAKTFNTWIVSYPEKLFIEKSSSNESVISEKAVSKKQQKFMGMVHAVHKGDMKSPSKEVAKAAKSLSKTEAKKFASTKHKGLPEKKKSKIKESAMDTQKKLAVSFINDICDENYSSARKNLAAYVDSKIKNRIRTAASSQVKPVEEKAVPSEDAAKIAKVAKKGGDISKKAKNFKKAAAVCKETK